ncbi:MAG: hypothetical protein CM15mP75_2990 [Flammeovirgaceae bacterium]|nr:MAG: hypothetical protein CM15mP75_2990 [Flammeovirgaceae bacterium]
MIWVLGCVRVNIFQTAPLSVVICQLYVIVPLLPTVSPPELNVTFENSSTFTLLGSDVLERSNLPRGNPLSHFHLGHRSRSQTCRLCFSPYRRQCVQHLPYRLYRHRQCHRIQTLRRHYNHLRLSQDQVYLLDHPRLYHPHPLSGQNSVVVVVHVNVVVDTVTVRIRCCCRRANGNFPTILGWLIHM